MKQIKENHRRLIFKWHPDTSSENRDSSIEMTQKLNEAYRIIREYCSRYKFSFTEEEAEKYVSTEEWWWNRFGSDPIWGGGDDS